MRAMLARQTGPIESSPLELVELPTPEPARGEVRIRVACCGVCLTDLHVVEGDLPWRGPVVPGHQIIGTVDACGPGVGRFKGGEPVGVAWLATTCGTCRHCTGDDENLCERARFTGYDVAGGYAEFAVANADFVYDLPERLRGPEAAPLLCAGIIGYRALRLSGAAPGKTLGLYGFGAAAHIAIQIAVRQGCDVYVFTRSESHRALARSLGASWVGGAGDSAPKPLHAAIIFAPAGRLVPMALAALDRGGTVALAGIHMSQIPPLDYREHLYFEKKLRSVTNNTRADGDALLSVAAGGELETTINLFPLEDANAALDAVKHSKIDGAAVLGIAKDT